jgi:hypothetical protein
MSNQTEGFYSARADYSNAVFGTLRVVGTIQSPTGFKFLLHCDPTLGGCNCRGQVVTQVQLSKTKVGTLKCANSGHASSLPGVNRPVDRPSAARCEVRMSDDTRYRSRSARAQLEDRQRAEEIAAIEKGGQ